MEETTLGVEAATRVEHAAQAEQGGQQRHGGGQTINHQHDAERGRPVAEGVNAQRAVIGQERQPGACGYAEQAGEQADGTLERQARLKQQQQRGEQGNQDRQDGRVLAHGRSSSSRAST